MSTARDLINSTLRLIGAIATGETASAEESKDALEVLNEMLDSWSLESLIIFTKVREVFPLVPSQQAYTMGPLGDFDTVRPIRIERAAQENLGHETGLEILNPDQWALISNKSIESQFPSGLFVQGTTPLETLQLWPIPSEVINLVLYSWKPLTQIATINDQIEFPPGYKKALRYNLALELCPEYGKPPDTAIVAGALESRENIKRINIKPQYLGTDLGTLGHFNINTGE